MVYGYYLSFWRYFAYLNTVYVSWFIVFKYDMRIVVYFNYFI